MTLLLVLATILTAALLLSVLAVGLLLILKALQSVRGSLEQIAMGVRAIESQVDLLGPGVAEVRETLPPLADALARAAGGMDRATPLIETRLAHPRR